MAGYFASGGDASGRACPAACAAGLFNSVEEVSMKLINRPSVTEMERGCVYEMEIEISSIHFFDTWSVHPFHIGQNSSKIFLNRNMDILISDLLLE